MVHWLRLPSNAGRAGSISGLEDGIPSASWSKGQNKKTEEILSTNSIKTLKMVHTKKKKKRTIKLFQNKNYWALSASRGCLEARCANHTRRDRRGWERKGPGHLLCEGRGLQG